MSTLQTSAPIERLSLQATNREAHWLADMVQRGDATIDPPYQRGAVWTAAQQIALIWSFLAGVPIPAVIINDRSSFDWSRANPGYSHTDPYLSVIDGKQRILAVSAWFSGQLAVPASWFKSDQTETTEDTADGPYVRYPGLTEVGRRVCARKFLIPCAEAHLPTVEEEAKIYLLVNGGGTPQTDADLANAAQIAER